MPIAAPVSVSFDTLDHFLVIPAQLAGTIDLRMIFDSGIGVTLLSDSACQLAGGVRAGSYTGERMSGQAITVPLARVPALAIGGHRTVDVPVGVIAHGEILPAGIDGIVSLALFRAVPFTFDHRGRRLVFEDDASLGARAEAGTVVPLELIDDGVGLTAFLQLSVPGGPPARVQVDTGSQALILDERYLVRLGIEPAGPGVTRRVGEDETGHVYERRFAEIAGAVAPLGAPELAQSNPRVMFQRIIHDGLIGQAFLSRFTVTWDLPAHRLILSHPR